MWLLVHADIKVNACGLMACVDSTLSQTPRNIQLTNIQISYKRVHSPAATNRLGQTQSVMGRTYQWTYIANWATKQNITVHKRALADHWYLALAGYKAVHFAKPETHSKLPDHLTYMAHRTDRYSINKLGLGRQNSCSFKNGFSFLRLNTYLTHL